MVSSTASEDRAAFTIRKSPSPANSTLPSSLKMEALEGLSGLCGKSAGAIRARTRIRTPSFRPRGNFQPSHWQSGTQWRLMTFGLEYETPELLGIKEFVTLRGGWLQPQKEFVDQPLSKLFVNNAFESSKGIGAQYSVFIELLDLGRHAEDQARQMVLRQGGPVHGLSERDLEQQPRPGLRRLR